jgi:hypothetical protein
MRPGQPVLSSATSSHMCIATSAMKYYAVIMVFGSFTGGDFVVPQLKLKFPFRSGDVIFIKGHMLEHFVTPWQPEGHDGGRFSVVHFNHQAVVDWVNAKLDPSPE